MTRALLAAALLASGALLTAQEREIPKDSALLTLRGCATGRTFLVGPRSEHAPQNLEIPPGRRFRMNGKKEVLEQIKRGESRMVEITGLVRKADLAGPGGVAVAGGRIRIGGADPRQPVGGSPSREAIYNQVVIDVESSKPLEEPCPAR
jgi:hypothetical protein